MAAAKPLERRIFPGSQVVNQLRLCRSRIHKRRPQRDATAPKGAPWWETCHAIAAPILSSTPTQIH